MTSAQKLSLGVLAIGVLFASVASVNMSAVCAITAALLITLGLLGFQFGKD